MKKIVFTIALISFWGCQQDKTGFVNNVQLMEGYKEKTAAEERYAEQRETFNEKRDSISRAFQMEAQAMEAEMQSMSQNKAQEVYSNLQQKGQRIGQLLQQEEQQMNLVGRADMDSIVQKVRREIEAYGKANGYSYIFGGGEGGGVLYGAETKDLTEEILNVLNAKNDKE